MMDFTTKLAEIHVAGTEGRAIDAGSVGAVGSLYCALQGVKDGRKRRGRRYPAAAVLTIIVLSKMAGESTLVGIAEWAQLRVELLCRVFGLRRLPCANTYCYICDHIELAELNQVICGYFRQASSGSGQASAAKQESALGISPAAVEHMACDGKELRGTYRRPRVACQAPVTKATAKSAPKASAPKAVTQGTLGIYSVSRSCLEALLPIAGKGREAATLFDYLSGRNCQNLVITADALHTQRRLCRLIRRQQGHYLFVVKRNQKSLYEDIRFLFSCEPNTWFPEQTAKTVDYGHGRIEIRRIRTTCELNLYLADQWPGVAQVFLVERQVTEQGRTTRSFVGGITSLTPAEASPQRLLQLLRDHWHIENRNHWRRDASLREDACKVASIRAALTLAMLNNAVLFLLDQAGRRNSRSAMRLFNAEPQQALNLILQPL
jgi:predicted transposase YbfD/YdcC